MKILIIEDEDFKLRRIEQVTRKYSPDSEIRSCRSVTSGLRAIDADVPDVILLDMSLTTFDVGAKEPGGRPQNFGGLEVLSQLDRLSVQIPVVVVTQFNRFGEGEDLIDLNALRKKLRTEYGDIFHDVIFYNSAQTRWEAELAKTLRSLEDRK